MTWNDFWRPRLTDMVSRRARWPVPFIVVWVALVVTTGALWYGLKVQETTVIVETVAQELAWGKAALINQARYYMMASQRMGQRWDFYGDLHRQDWEYDARYYLSQDPGLVAMAWVDAAYHTRYVVSNGDSGVIEDIGPYLKEKQPDVFEAAKLSRSPQFSKIIRLENGDNRAFMASPLFIKGRFVGFLVDVFDINLAFGSVLKTSIAEGWVYRLSDGRYEIQTSDVVTSPKSEKWFQSTLFQIPGTPAILKIVPGPQVLARLHSHFSEVALVVGIALTGLFTWGAGSAQKIKIKSDELRDATTLLRQMQEAMDSSAIISTTDVQGVITYANDNFCKISQYSSEELVGQNHRIIKSGIHPQEYYADVWRTIAHGKVWKGEFCNKAKDGSYYWVYATIFPLMGEEGRPRAYMAIRHDITDRKRLEEELHRSNHALEEFDHVVAHELKTPLTVIKMTAENLISADMGPLNPAQEKAIGMIDRNVNQLATTINNLLHMAQLNASGADLDVRSLDPKQYMEKVIQNLREVAHKRNVSIHDTIPMVFPKIKGSPEVFTEILTNLLSNAIRYASHEVVVEARITPGWAHFGVRDDGPGIPKERLAGLFEKFSRDSKSQTSLFQGNGLGLYICKDLLRKMGGNIWAESEEGQGSSFFFTLPIAGSEPSVTDA